MHLLKVLFFVILLPAQAVCQTGVKSSKRAEALIKNLNEFGVYSRGVLGIAALCIETGERINLNGLETFPMASTYKLPIGIYFLHQVHSGLHILSDTVLIDYKDLSPGHSPLAQDVIFNGPVYVSKLDLLKRMVSDGDNTASDKILEMTGGAKPINAYLVDQGIKEIHVDRSEKLLNAHALGVSVSGDEDWSLELFEKLVSNVSSNDQNKAIRRLLKDSRDSSTPVGMMELLEMLYDRKLKEFSHYPLLLEMMTKTQTGANRIKGLLPASYSVAHKTGTHVTIGGVNGATNDVGIVTTTDGQYHIILAIFLKGSTLGNQGRESIIAQSAKAICDHFTVVKKQGR